MNDAPWDVSSSLQSDRLEFIGSLIGQIWAEVAFEHNPALGDSSWGRGCKTYDRIVNRFPVAAESVPWLKVFRKSLYLLLLIDGVPLRYYRGDFDRPNKRSMKIQNIEDELRQPTLFELKSAGDEKWHWRIVAERGVKGDLGRLGIVQWTRSGKSRNLWLFPQDCLLGLTQKDQFRVQPQLLSSPQIRIKDTALGVTQNALSNGEISRKSTTGS